MPALFVTEALFHGSLDDRPEPAKKRLIFPPERETARKSALTAGSAIKLSLTMPPV